MSKVMQHHRKLTNVADGQQDSRVPVDSTATALRSSDWVQDSKPSFDTLPLDILELIAEALVSRGHVKSLGQLNATSKNVYHKTLRILWRTVVWDPRDRTPAEANVYWKRLMVDSPGSGHIQFLIDRTSFIPITTKELPDFIKTASAYQAGTMRGYVARLDDRDQVFIDCDDCKILVHLLPQYRPLSEDVVTLRHALYQLFPGEMPESLYYSFVVHSPNQRPQRNLPASLDAYKVFPSMPYRLDSVCVVPQAGNFLHSDRKQLAGIAFDFLAAIGHAPDPSWNGYLGEFGSQPIMAERNCEGCYLEFTSQDSPESAVICAESTAEVLERLRHSHRPWLPLDYSIDSVFPRNNDAIHRILRTIRPFYLERAASRLFTPRINNGDVTVQDGSHDLLAGLKRVVPPKASKRKNAKNLVEYFLKRYPPGKGKDAETMDFASSHLRKHDIYDEYLYEEYPV